MWENMSSIIWYSQCIVGFTCSAVVVFCNYHTRGGRLIIVLSIDMMLVVIEYCQTFNHHISAKWNFLLIYTPLLLLLLLLTLHHYYAAFNSFLNSSINAFAVTIHCSRKLWQIKSLLNKEIFFSNFLSLEKRKMLLQDGRDGSIVDDNNNACVATKLEHYKDTKWWQISSDDHSGNEDKYLVMIIVGMKMTVSLIHLLLHCEKKDQKYIPTLDLWETMM